MPSSSSYDAPELPGRGVKTYRGRNISPQAGLAAGATAGEPSKPAQIWSGMDRSVIRGAADEWQGGIGLPLLERGRLNARRADKTLTIQAGPE